MDIQERLTAFAMLARTSELVVTRAAGVSAWRLIAPAIISAALLGVFASRFDRLDRVALGLRRQHRTGVDSLPIYQHGASATLPALAAAIFDAKKALPAQHDQQCIARGCRQDSFLTINL